MNLRKILLVAGLSIILPQATYTAEEYEQSENDLTTDPNFLDGLRLQSNKNATIRLSKEKCATCHGGITHLLFI